MKTCWSEIKNNVQKINPVFYELIEAVAPDNDLALNIFEFPYGSLVGDNKFIPDEGNHVLPGEETQQSLKMVLEGTGELYLETATNVIPWKIFVPGTIFPISSESDRDLPLNARVPPGNIFKLTAGSRSAFILPLHSYNESYDELKKYYEIPNKLNPTNPLDHHHIFKTIAERENASWRFKLMYFDKKWRENIWYNKAWSDVKAYFYQQALMQSSLMRANLFLTYAMRDIAKSNNFKHKDYSEDIIKQIFLSLTPMPSGMGGLPVFAFSEDESALPMSLLANIFNQFYGTHNLPVIVHSARIQERKEMLLSISQNSVTTYDIKTFRPLMYLNEVKEYLPQYLKAFKQHLITEETMYANLDEQLHIRFYSEKGAPSNAILRAADLKCDPRLHEIYKSYKIKTSQSFPERAPFLKAFVVMELSQHGCPIK